MASQMSLMLRADPSGFEDGINDAITAIRNWETQTDRSADNASQALEEAIRGVITLGKATDKSADEMKSALRGLGLSAEDAEDAFKAIERETADLGRSASRDIDRVEDAVDDLGRAAETTAGDIEDVGEAADGAAEKTKGIRDATETVGDGVRSLGDIAKGALSGDFASAAGGAAEAISGLIGTFAGGAAGGAVGSVIGGAIASWINELDLFGKKAQEVRDELAGALIDIGGAFDDATWLSRMREAAQDTEKWSAANIIFETTNLTMGEALRAVAGDAQAAKEAFDQIEESQRNGGKTIHVAMKDLLTTQQILEGVAGAGDVFATKSAAISEGMTGIARESENATKKVSDLKNQMQTVPEQVTATISVSADTSSAMNKINALRRQAGITIPVTFGGAQVGRQLLQ